MRAFKNCYIKCTVTGPITSWCSRSTQFVAGIKIAVIGTSASEDTDRTQGLQTTWPAKSVSQDSEIARVGHRKLYVNALEKEVWAMG